MEIYWVVGSDENVGKTTVAGALLDVLNDQGARAIGFKPYSAGKFIDLIDVLNSPEFAGNGRICGSDGLHLCEASRIIARSEAELIQPVIFICYPKYNKPLIMRTGSELAGRVSYWKGPEADRLLQDTSLFRNIPGIDIDAWRRFPVSNLQFPYAPQFGEDFVEACFQRLITDKAPDNVVCEGAGPWLPVWRTRQDVNHILFIDYNTIYFFRNINTKVSRKADELVLFNDLMAAIGRSMTRKARLPFAMGSDRQQMARDMVRELISEA